MWLFTKYGFYSVTLVKDATLPNGVDRNMFQVRARCREHLENLLDAFDETLALCKIIETTDSDYQFRILVIWEDWKIVHETLLLGIDYSNFKQSVHDYEDTGTGPVKHSPYEQALMQVWQIMQSLQPLPPWSDNRGAKRSYTLVKKAKGKGKPPLRGSKRGRS